MNEIGIRCEDKSPWERRVPLVPRDVRWLQTQHSLETVVQTSETRAFADEEFSWAGARVSQDLSGCPLVLGIKEIPADVLEPEKTYGFFAHVIKGQPQNMPMLRRVLDLGCTLIDYERIVDDRGRRLIFFGRQAGWAGTVDTLWALGQRLASESIPSPFQAIRPMPAYGGLAQAKAALDVVREWIRTEGLPGAVSPLVVGIAGYGNVSVGVQEILDLLPVIHVDPDDLAVVVQDKRASRHHIHTVVFKEQHMVEPRSAASVFELQDYYDVPEKYRSVFARYLPDLTVLINAIYWAPQYPRLVSIPDLDSLYAGRVTPKLKVIGDISCDIEGAIEATVRATDPGDPVYVYEPATGMAIRGYEGNGPVIMAVDILPSELPRESSTAFSHSLRGFIPSITCADYSRGIDALDLPDPVKKAIIAHKTKLAPRYRYLAQYLD